MPPSQDEPEPRPVGHAQLAGQLDRPVLRFDLPAEIAHLHAQPAWRDGHAPSSTTLVKHPDLRLVLVAMRRGEILPQHRTAARISVQVLSGRLRLRLPQAETELGAGGLLVLEHELQHEVEALEDSAFLLTLAWPGKEEED